MHARKLLGKNHSKLNKSSHTNTDHMENFKECSSLGRCSPRTRPAIVSADSCSAYCPPGPQVPFSKAPH